jgi:hypothetical protein
VSSKTEALRALKDFLEEHGLRYAVIGGLANTVWGRPRLTYDADVKVLLGDMGIGEFGALVGQRFPFRRPDAVAFAKRNYVLLVYLSEEVPADIIIGLLPYEELAVEKAIDFKIEGVILPVCQAEDLIVHKAISERTRDWADIEGILLRQRDALDQRYIVAWLAQFAATLDRPEMLRRYEDLRHGLGLSA